ncbi:MAG: 30S ribosomal protein S27ae [Thermoplasmatales archaeon]|nr:MAG: 30S ribosomal protein S27ae [Thermoplasmatales archaeon]
MMKREIFKIEGDKIIRLRRNCPKCGEGVFLAEHKDRLSCGKCDYTEFKVKKDKKPEATVEVKEEESAKKSEEGIKKPIEETTVKPDEGKEEEKTDIPASEEKTEQQ